MITFDQERPQDFAEIEALLDAAFGPKRHQKSSSVLRENNPALHELSAVLRCEGRVAATVRFTPVHVHDPLFDMHRDALLLGPLAVHPDMQSAGMGTALMNHALDSVDMLGFERVLLVGDVSFYTRFGFEPVLPRIITMPGGQDASRLLLRQNSEAKALPVVGTVLPFWVEDCPRASVQLNAA